MWERVTVTEGDNNRMQEDIEFGMAKIFLLHFITAFRALSDVFGSSEGNEGASNVTVIITNTISALSTSSANNTNTDSDTITNTLSGRSFS